MEDVDMTDTHLNEPEDGFRLPPSLRDLDQLQYHISLQEIGETLQRAANSAFPNDNRLKYTSVNVLLLCWEDEDPRLPVSIEVDELREVFENIYHYDVEVWRIPNEGSHKNLNRKILDFVEVGNDSKDELKIVYYGGHGMLARNRQSCWASRPDFKDPSYRMVKWSGIQHALEEAESDVLLLLDCCASGTANTDMGNGVTELIAACSFNTAANPVGPDSFTRALITELRLLGNAPSFTTGVLFNRMLCRMQHWMPAGREMQKPPVHVILTQNRKLPQSIQLSPVRLEKIIPSSQHQSPGHEPSPEDSTSNDNPEANEAPGPSQSSSSEESDGSPHSLQGSGPSSSSSLFSDTKAFPRIAISIRLKETLTESDFSVDLFEDWIRMMPVLADQVKIEAGFTSFSTLLVLSLPVAVWCYLPDHPAVSLMGLIKCPNLAPRGQISTKEEHVEAQKQLPASLGEHLTDELATKEKNLYAEKQLTMTLEEALTDVERERDKAKADTDKWRQHANQLGYQLAALMAPQTPSGQASQDLESANSQPDRSVVPLTAPADTKAPPAYMYEVDENGIPVGGSNKSAHLTAPSNEKARSAYMYDVDEDGVPVGGSKKSARSKEKRPFGSDKSRQHGAALAYGQPPPQRYEHSPAQKYGAPPLQMYGQPPVQQYGSTTSPSSYKTNDGSTDGIFTGTIIDGPEIGTLVVIIDRAKNLPNRKTIGKQDPYCAARLGKEAKKTATDRRGGQTPRWDQELRFTVHDSEDYYQLKVSIFNDDKRTDLIGETWIDLRDVIVRGGGQSDLWHSLKFKGKYAGEVRIELTYYDTRPKREKSIVQRVIHSMSPLARRAVSEHYTSNEDLGPSSHSLPPWTPDWRVRSSSASVLSSGTYSSNASSIPPPEGIHNIYALPPLDESYMGPFGRGPIDEDGNLAPPLDDHKGTNQLSQISVDSRAHARIPKRRSSEKFAVTGSFRTDTAISGHKNQGERILQKWSPDPPEDTYDSSAPTIVDADARPSDAWGLLAEMKGIDLGNENRVQRKRP